MRKNTYLTLLLSFMLLFGTAYAQEAAKNKIFVFKDFSGGIATKLVDSSTNQKYARIAENVRLNSAFKAITKRDQLYIYGTASTDPITGMHRLYQVDLDKSLIVTYGDMMAAGNDSTGAFTSILTLTYPEYRWEFETWHDLAIGGDGYNSPVKTDGTDATYIGSLFCSDNGAGSGPNGTYNYKVTCHTAAYCLDLNQVSNNVTVVDNDIDLSWIPIGPDTFLGESIAWRTVWRSDNTGAGTYKKLSNGRIDNNTATTLTDSDADGALLATAYPTGNELWTPPKGKHYLIHRNRLFIANNPTYPSRIYWSEDGSHDLFDPLSYFDIRENDGDEITFIKNLLGICTIGKTNTIQKLYTTGDDPAADWEVSDPFSFIGCDAGHSAVNTPIGIVYLSRAKSGIYVFNGQNSVLKSEQVTPIIQDILSSNLEYVWSEYNNNIIYMAYPSASEGGSTNNRLLVYDMLADAYTIDTLSLNCLTSFTGSSDGGELCAGSSVDGKVFSFTNTAQTVIHKRHSDFIGTWAHTRYLPTDIGGDPNSPVIEIAWDNTVDASVGLIDNLMGDVNRQKTDGTYISQILSLPGVTNYDKLFWNEDLTPAHAGCHAEFYIRGGSTHTACHIAAWSGGYTSSAGSDISALTAYPYTQYKIALGTNDIDYTPEIYTLGGFTVKLSYKKLGTAAETSIAMHWQTGILDFDLPAYRKMLRKIVVWHEGTNGTLTITFTNEHGDTDTFDIDMAVNPTFYEAYFTGGGLMGNKFKMDVTNSDMNAVKIKEIILVADIEPLY